MLKILACSEEAVSISTIAFHPKAGYKNVDLAGLLTYSLFNAFPWAAAHSGSRLNNCGGAYSYGDSPGFTPGSLLMQSAEGRPATKFLFKVIT